MVPLLLLYTGYENFGVIARSILVLRLLIYNLCLLYFYFYFYFEFCAIASSELLGE